MTDWHYKVMGDEVGPVSSRMLRELAQAGDITRDTLVRKGNEGDWVRAERVKGLFADAPVLESGSPRAASCETSSEATSPPARPVRTAEPDSSPRTMDTQKKKGSRKKRKPSPTRPSIWLICVGAAFIICAIALVGIVTVDLVGKFGYDKYKEPAALTEESIRRLEACAVELSRARLGPSWENWVDVPDPDEEPFWVPSLIGQALENQPGAKAILEKHGFGGPEFVHHRVTAQAVIGAIVNGETPEWDEYRQQSERVAKRVFEQYWERFVEPLAMLLILATDEVEDKKMHHLTCEFFEVHRAVASLVLQYSGQVSEANWHLVLGHMAENDGDFKSVGMAIISAPP